MFYLDVNTFAVGDEDFVLDPALSIVFSPSAIPVTECATIEILQDLNVECNHSFSVHVGLIDCDVDPPIIIFTLYAVVVIVDDDGRS